MALLLSILVQHVPAYSSLGNIKNLYVTFSYPHMRNECSHWEWPGLTGEKTIFSSTWMCGGWWSNCWPFCHPYPHSNSGEEKKLSMYNLWPCPSIFLVSSVTVAWVAVTCCAVRCLSFPKYTFMSYVYPAESQSLKILMPKLSRFFGMYCLEITLPLKGTITSSTARFSEGLQNLENVAFRISNRSHIFHSLSKFSCPIRFIPVVSKM